VPGKEEDMKKVNEKMINIIENIKNHFETDDLDYFAAIFAWGKNKKERMMGKPPYNKVMNWNSDMIKGIHIEELKKDILTIEDIEEEFELDKQIRMGEVKRLKAKYLPAGFDQKKGGRRRTRGKLRAKSRAKSRKKRRRKRTRKRRKSRRRKRTRKRRRKNLKKQVGGENKFSENIMDIIRGNEHIIKLKDKGLKTRPTNCRGATHVLISELIELVDAKYIGWGDWAGHSVAIVKAGGEIQEHIRIDLAEDHDDIGNYYVFDGSFHQILEFEDVKSIENILFTGKLEDYYNKHYSKSGRTDTKLSILPIAKNLDWVVWDKSEYGSILD